MHVDSQEVTKSNGEHFLYSERECVCLRERVFLSGDGVVQHIRDRSYNSASMYTYIAVKSCELRVKHVEVCVKDYT